MIICLECDLTVGMPSFYLQLVILKTKCIISQQETTGDDEERKICSNKLSLVNVLTLPFLFSPLELHVLCLYLLHRRK
jgi:hypothetical protein